MNGPNKRAFPRVNAMAGNYASFVEGAAVIRDLSMGGVLVEDPQPLSSGTSVSLTLHLGVETVSCRGVVRRSDPQQGMGIQFVEVSAEERKRLGGYLRQLSIAESRQRLTP